MNAEVYRTEKFQFEFANGFPKKERGTNERPDEPFSGRILLCSLLEIISSRFFVKGASGNSNCGLKAQK